MVVSAQTRLLVWKSLPRRVWYCSKTRAAFWCKCGTCWRVLGKRAGNDFFFFSFPCWMASPTRWTWVWVNSGSWWWTGRPGVLRFMGSQRVGHGWATELNWTELNWVYSEEAEFMPDKAFFLSFSFFFFCLRLLSLFLYQRLGELSCMAVMKSALLEVWSPFQPYCFRFKCHR